MTLRHTDSFDHYNTVTFMGQKWSSLVDSGDLSVSAGNGRNSTASCRLASNGTAKYLALSLDNQATWVVGLAWKLNNASVSNGNMPLVTFLDGTSTQVDIRILADGTIRATRNGTTLGTSTVVITFNGWQYIEVQVKIHSSTGTVQVWKNGVSILSLTGQNTQATGNATASQIQIGNGSANAGGQGLGGTQDIDDIYIMDGVDSGVSGAPNNAAIGDYRVEAVFAAANGADTGWTNNGGDANKFNTISENPPVTTKYLSTSTVPDSYTATWNNPATSGTIKGVIVWINAEKDDANTTTLADIIRYSSTDNLGATFNPANGTYAFFGTVHNSNPGTAAQWAYADFASTEFGVKRTA